MSYSDYEKSTFDAAPVELYSFEYGLAAYRYTSADAQYTVDNKLYTPAPISRTQIDQSNEDQAGSITVTVPATSPVAALFIAYLPAVPVYLRVMRFHRGSADVTTAFAGEVCSARFKEDTCELVCNPVTYALTRKIPVALYQPQCNHTLFSQSKTYGAPGHGTSFAQAPGCNVSKDAYRTQATVQSLDGLTLRCAAFADKADGYFAGGYIEVPATGELRWIKSHAGAVVTLSHPLKLVQGDPLLAYPGCDGTESTCRTKFNNVINFTGFSRMPAKNPFTSSLQ